MYTIWEMEKEVLTPYNIHLGPWGQLPEINRCFVFLCRELRGHENDFIMGLDRQGRVMHYVTEMVDEETVSRQTYWETTEENDKIPLNKQAINY